MFVSSICTVENLSGVVNVKSAVFKVPAVALAFFLSK
jgi:hypothetical protein